MAKNVLYDNEKNKLTEEQKSICIKDILTIKFFSDNAKKYISPALTTIGEIILLQAFNEVIGNGK